MLYNKGKDGVKLATIIDALINIAANPISRLSTVSRDGTRINIVGYSLEEYVKNAFADTFEENPTSITHQSQIFSWQGNQNNPPDLILRGSDAIEIKKMGGTGDIALNSSYPHAKLHSSSPMITKDCKRCEGDIEWEKDVVYAIGTVTNNTIKYLFFVYGDIYAASNDVYERIRNHIKEGIAEISDVELSETKELGRVNRVDPLGISHLRVRGMWTIQHPFTVYSYISQISKPRDNSYHVFALISNAKFNTFDRATTSQFLALPETERFDIYVKNPNNPSQLVECVLLRLDL